MMRGRDTEREAIKEAENGLAWVKEKAAEAGIDCTTHLLIRGMSVGEDVVAFAKESKADLVYIGIRRRSRVGKLLMGSNAQYIILNAPCPVTTVK
jgi:nucleotide-binding universal stress UspA family protein